VSPHRDSIKVYHIFNLCQAISAFFKNRLKAKSLDKRKARLKNINVGNEFL